MGRNKKGKQSRGKKILEKQEQRIQTIFIFTKLLIVLAWSMLIVALMTEPLPLPDNLQAKFTLYDKVVHIFMFGGLTMAWLLFLQELKDFTLKWAIVFSLLTGVVFAIFMEYVQQYIPGRMSNGWDLTFGILGMIMAIIIYAVYIYKQKPKVLLHICCATCGVYVSQLLGQDYRVHLFYSNSNIAPKKEFDKRIEEVKFISKKFHLPLTVDKYNHTSWLKKIKGHEQDKEKGERCCICYEYRLVQTVKQAKKLGIKYFASTLSVSPHKLAKVINEKGEELSKKHKIEFLVRDFKKQDGYKKSVELSKKFDFYRQDYCGCEFSYRDSKAKK